MHPSVAESKLSAMRTCTSGTRHVCAGRHPTRFGISTHVVGERMMGSMSSFSEDEDGNNFRVRVRRGNRAPTAPPTLPPISSPSTTSGLGTTSSDDSSSTQAAPVPGAGPSQIFNETHLPNPWHPTFIAYAPFGVVLAVFRMACWVLGVLVDAPWFRNPAVVQGYLKLLGFTAKWKNLHLLPKGHHVMVSNHTTSSDLMVLFTLPQRYTHLITSAMPARVTATRHLPVVLRPASVDVYERLAKDHADAMAQGGAAAANALTPVHVFPEGGLTNGNACMQFSRGFMKFVVPGSTSVVPVALRARTPWGIRTHTLTSSFLANLFWLSFCPWMEVEAEVLPPTTQGTGEGRGAFVQRVQGQIADALQVPVSHITIQQKRQLMKHAEHKKKHKQ